MTDLLHVARVLPRTWLPPGRKVLRVICHWTAGTHVVNGVDVQHYHAIIAGDGHAVQGTHAAGVTAGHTRGLNTGSYGLALAAMAGAVQGGEYGQWPITPVQWERFCQAAAEVCLAYGIEPMVRGVLCHSEVQRVYGVVQRGKWDIDVLPFAPHMPPGQVHAELRGKVRWYLERLREEDARPKA